MVNDTFIGNMKVSSVIISDFFGTDSFKIDNMKSGKYNCFYRTIEDDNKVLSQSIIIQHVKYHLQKEPELVKVNLQVEDGIGIFDSQYFTNHDKSIANPETYNIWHTRLLSVRQNDSEVFDERCIVAKFLDKNYDCYTYTENEEVVFVEVRIRKESND